MALSSDLGNRIINAYNKQEGSIRSLAIRFSVSPNTIWLLLSKYKKEKDLKPRSPPGRVRKIDEKGLFILRLIMDFRVLPKSSNSLRMCAKYIALLHCKVNF
jgi:transposase